MKINRQELKYYINHADYKKLSRVLRHTLVNDKNTVSSEGYLVRSLYFDNIFNKAFHEKLEGIENRKKYRLRTYNLSECCVKFEIKNKFNTVIHKETALISKSDAVLVQNGKVSHLLRYNNPTLNKIYCEFSKQKYLPVVMVEYLREAYYLPINNIRITFDKKLSYDAINLNIFARNGAQREVVDQSKVILEVKFNGSLPGWVRKILQTVPFCNTAISKYCMCRME